MNTDFIDSFVMVVESGSIAEAARRLNLTPTALALRVQTLEAEFGCPLLVRSGRTVRPTESGARLAAGAGKLQKAIRELRSDIHGEGIPSSIRFGSISTALSGWLPQHLEEVVRLYPRLDIQLLTGVSRDLYYNVQRDQLDMALIVAPPFEMPKSMNWRTVRREQLVVLAHKRHAFSNPLELLATEPHIRYDRRNWGGSLSEQYLQAQRIQPTERFELDALEALEVLVGLGMGVSLVPDWARANPMGKNLITLPVPNPLYREIGLVWPAGSAHERLLETLFK